MKKNSQKVNNTKQTTCHCSKKNGFSLIELIISMFVFVLIITASVGAFVAIFNARRSAKDIQKNLEEARTAMETIAKSIRMSNNLSGSSGSSGEFSGITMYDNSQGKCVAYKFDNVNGKLLKGIDPTKTADDCGSVIADKVVISGGAEGIFNITKTDSDAATPVIGRATMRIKITSGADDQYLQTTVSFRDYEKIFYD